MPQLLTLDLSGVRRKAEFFQEMAARLSDLTPVWETAHHLFIHEMIQQFLTQGAYLLGDQWTPLSPRYLAYKIRKWGVPPPPFGILYRTGELFASLTNEDSPFHVAVMTPDSATFGSLVYYGVFHQRGGKFLPQRRIISLSARYRRSVFRAAMAYVTRGYDYLQRDTGGPE